MASFLTLMGLLAVSCTSGRETADPAPAEMPSATDIEVPTVTGVPDLQAANSRPKFELMTKRSGELADNRRRSGLAMLIGPWS